MGLFGGGGFFGSGGKVSTTTNTTNNYTNESAIGASNQGNAVSGNDNQVQIQAFDPGAISAGLDISQAALDLGSEALKSGVSVFNTGLDNARSMFNSGIDVNRSIASSAISNSNDLASNVLDFAGGAINATLKQNQTLVDTNLQGLTDLSKQITQSNTQSTNESITKVVQYVAAGMAVIFIAWSFKK